MSTPSLLWRDELIDIALILSVAILSILSLYWAVLFRVEQNLSSLIVYVVDFDSLESGSAAFVGPAITQMTEQQVTASPIHLGYITMPPSDFNNDPMLVRRAIYEEEAYAAIVINANASSMLQSAVATGNASYDPLGACQLIYITGRDQDTYYDYLIPELQTLQTDATSMIGQMWTARVMANNSISRTNLAAAPQALSPAIGFSTYDLRPFYPYQTTPSVTIGLIYLIIISFFSFSFYMPIHMTFMSKEKHPPLKPIQLMIWRWLSAIAAYFLLSLAYSLVSLAFQVPFAYDHASPEMAVPEGMAQAYGKGSFPVYWMLNWVGMIALGLACENVAMVVGMPWASLWLIFWVITNVSTSFYAIDLEPHFFYWGVSFVFWFTSMTMHADCFQYAWPLQHIVQASRTIIYDTKSHIGLNFGVLFAWCAINTFLYPFACKFMSWKQQKGQKKEQEKNDKKGE